jgi:hypothetical protein
LTSRVLCESAARTRGAHDVPCHAFPPDATAGAESNARAPRRLLLRAIPVGVAISELQIQVAMIRSSGFFPSARNWSRPTSARRRGLSARRDCRRRCVAAGAVIGKTRSISLRRRPVCSTARNDRSISRKSSHEARYHRGRRFRCRDRKPLGLGSRGHRRCVLQADRFLDRGRRRREHPASGRKKRSAPGRCSLRRSR